MKNKNFLILCLILALGPIAVSVRELLQTHHWYYYLAVSIEAVCFVINLVCLILYIRANKKNNDTKQE